MKTLIPGKNILIAFFLFFVLTGAVAITTVRIYTHLILKTQQQKEDETIKKIARIIVLPSGNPEITVIGDIGKFLSEAPDFYKDATNGAVLIKYPSESILYNPTSNKILNIFSHGIFNKDMPKNPLKISFRYGGNEQARALLLASQITETTSKYQIVEVVPSSLPYKNDVVYMVNKNRENEIKEFAAYIGNSPVLDRPEEKETATESDLIVAFAEPQAIIPKNK